MHRLIIDHNLQIIMNKFQEKNNMNSNRFVNI